MTIPALLFLFAAAVLAFGISTVSGGGAGLLLLPVLAQVVPAASVPAALTVGTASSTVSKLALFRRAIRWDITRAFVPGAVPGVLLGVFVLRFLNPLYLEVLIGLFLLSNLSMLFRKQVPTAAEVPATWERLAFTGLVAGFLSGLTGAVGLLFNQFYFRHGLTRDEVIGTRAANEVLLHLIKLVLYLSLGLLTGPALLAGVVVAVGAILATNLTKRVVQHLPEQLFRRIGYGAMVVSGAFMLTSAVRSLQQSQNLGASLAFYGRDVEVTGWWVGGSVTLEWEYDEGLAIEHQIPYAQVPAARRQRLEQLRLGDPVIKVEQVWQWHERYYELYLNHHGTIRKLEIAA